MVCARQIREGIDTPNKDKNFAILDNLDLRKFYVETDGQRYPRDSVIINHEENDYIEQYKNLKKYYRECFGEQLINPFFLYLDMETKDSIKIIDLRHQADHKTPKKCQLFQEYGAYPNNARLFLILIRQREMELLSDGIKLVEFK